MEPKFQSSFIPKGPMATAGTATKISRESHRSLLGTLASIVFALTLIAGGGIFGYEFYLNHNIDTMKVELTKARDALDPESINQIANLNERIIAARSLVQAHVAITPLFKFLEANTLKSVRYTNFDFQSDDTGAHIDLHGQARGYSTLALQSQYFLASDMLSHVSFSDLDLDDHGNVTFSFKSDINPTSLLFKTLYPVPTGSTEIPLPQTPVAPTNQTQPTTGSTTTPSTQSNPPLI